MSIVPFAGLVALLVTLIVLEGRRQRRRYGPGSGRGASLSGVGLLEVQKLLQPDRRVDLLMQQQKGEIAEVGTDDQGDDDDRKGGRAD